MLETVFGGGGGCTPRGVHTVEFGSDFDEVVAIGSSVTTLL